jgi:NAD(P)H-flavin reductase
MTLLDVRTTNPGPAARPGDLVPAPWRVVDVHRELATTVTLDLVPLEGPPPRFEPAQFNMLSVFGVGEVPISISTDADHPEVQGHTVRAAGAVTTALCGLRPGDMVGVRGPFGNSWGCEHAEGADVVIMGGGIGLAPLRPAIYHVLNRRPRYGRVAVLLGARTPSDLLFGAEISTWRSRFDVDVFVTVDRADQFWRGPTGVVTRHLARTEADWTSAYAFVCGPDVMMQVAAAQLMELGMPAEHIRITLERNMKCAVGLCGHCQLGGVFVCIDGPVVRYADIAAFYGVEEA